MEGKKQKEPGLTIEGPGLHVEADSMAELQRIMNERKLESRAQVNALTMTSLAKGMKISEVVECLPALEAAFNAKAEMSEHFNGLCQSVAFVAGVSQKALKAYIAAKCTDKILSTKETAEQLQILFNEIGAS